MSLVTAAHSASTAQRPREGDDGTHFIERGDTLSGLAARYGTTVQALMDANPQIRNRDLIYAGDTLRLPGATAASGARAGQGGGATLAQLAARHDGDVATLARRNGLADPTRPWMTIARGEMGQREIAGGQDNGRIVQYHQTTSLRANDDETPWCASFVNWTMEQAGMRGTDSAAAISWAGWGQNVGGLGNARSGDVVVIRNRQTGQNHVGFFVTSGDGRVTLLGGNQSNQVKESSFGLGTYDIVAVRRPPTAG